MAEWTMIPGRRDGQLCGEGHYCCSVGAVHGHTFTLAACPTCSPATSPYQAAEWKPHHAVEMVAAAIEDRDQAEREVERLKAALADERERADRMAAYIRAMWAGHGARGTDTEAARALIEHDAAREAAR